MAEHGPLNELLAHLRRLQDSSDPEPLSTPLVEQSRYLLFKPGLRPGDVVELAHLTLTLLRISRDDVEPLVGLLSAAIELVTFGDLQTSIPVDVVTKGLSSSSPSVQNLGLSYLKKAAESPSGAAFVANNDALVKALIGLFLTSKSADIGGSRALDVTLSLLQVDSPNTVTTVSDHSGMGETTGQGLLWRRMFRDEEIYHLFFHLTSADGSRSDRSSSDITTSQARLLDFILGAANLNWDAICKAPKFDQPAFSKTQATGNGYERSLLPYAAFTMVDQTDPLMTNILGDFLTKLLEVRNPAGCSRIASLPAASSPSLEFLVSSGLHQKAIDYYLRSQDFDAFEIRLLGGAQVRYLCTYSDLYGEHFLQSEGLAQNTIQHLNRNLHISGARWAHGMSPAQDLNVLAHLPAITLAKASTSDQNPLMLVPITPTNADALETLGKIFHGPNNHDSDSDEDLVAQSDPFTRGSRAAVARVLFYQYRDRHPEFWSSVGAAMNVLAMPQAVSAAIGVVRSILRAVWARLAENATGSVGPSSLPTEQNLRKLCGGNISQTGIAEVLTSGESAIQSLLTPMKAMGGDAEVTKKVWRLGREKFDLLVLLSDLMKKGVGKAEVPSHVWQDIKGRIQERIRLGAGGAFTPQTNLVGTIGR
jgi:hypothetical protein